MRVVIYLPSEVRIFTPNPDQMRALAHQLPGCELLPVESEQELRRELPNCDAAVVWSFSKDWYASSPRLRHVFTPAAGRERVEPDPSGRAATHHGQFHGHIMAESLLAMLLFMNRGFGQAIADQHARRWERSPYEGSVGLAGQVVLLVGYGAIARHSARLLGSLGMRVQGLKRDPSTGAGGAERVFSLDQLELALSSADHVACTLPGDTNSTNLIDARALRAMKTSAFLYNVGRGNAIDLNALAEALRERRIAGAFLDVLPQEPPAEDCPAFDAPNLFLTPHASAIRRDYLDLYLAELAPQLLEIGQRLS